MSAEPIQFSIRVENTESGETAVVCVEGELDLAVAPELEEALSSEKLDGVEAVVVDMTGLSFMDSSGLRTLLVAHERFSREGRRWALAMDEESDVRRVLSLTEVEGRLPIFASRQEALASLPGQAGTG